MDRGNIGAIAFAAVILCVIGACLFSPLGDWLSIDKLKDSRAWLVQLVEARPLIYGSAFF
nr:hypothetical protein [Sphingomonas sp.]